MSKQERSTRNRSSDTSLGHKRAQVAGDRARGRGRPPYGLLAGAVIVAALATAILMFAVQAGDRPTAASMPAAPAAAAGDAQRRSVADFQTVAPKGDVIELAVSDLADGRARFFTLVAGGKEIDFFAVQGPDGKVRTAIDSCDLCYQARRGYRQEGSEMICNNCGQRFPIARIGEVRGGCNPVPLPSATADGTIVIEVDELTSEGGRYF